jgi:hypothetical protein
MMQNRDMSAPNASIQKRRVMAVALFLRDYRIAREELRRGASIMIGNRWTGGQVIATEAQFHDWFIDGLNRKINMRGGILAERGKWRKWNQDYQGRLWRDHLRLWQIRHLRYRIYQFETEEVRSRFGYLLADRREDEEAYG